jgi:hypothetical protein
MAVDHGNGDHGSKLAIDVMCYMCINNTHVHVYNYYYYLLQQKLVNLMQKMLRIASTYFVGNSLGLQPKCASELVQARDREREREESI